MKARTFKTIDDGVYKVAIYTEDWSEADTRLMLKYDEPELDLGGSFTGVATFTLPSKLVRVRNGSPFSVSFDSRDLADAQDRCDTWASTILVRLESTITTLRANVDEFTTESVVTI